MRDLKWPLWGPVFALVAAVTLLAVPAVQARDSLAFGGSYDVSSLFGANGPGSMDIDQASKVLYVVDSSNNRILKFDISDPLNPVPANFSALGGNAITTHGESPGTPLALAQKANIAVDNSDGPQAGTIYLATNTTTDSRAYAYSASGEFLYAFAHASDQTFDLNGTPQTGRAIAVAPDGPRAGEIFRLGHTGDNSAIYSPSATPGEPPTVRIPSMVRTSPLFDVQFPDAMVARFNEQGQTIHYVQPGTFLGNVFTALEASTLETEGTYNFGTAWSATDFTVAQDGNLLIRRSNGDGGFGRFRQTGIARTFPPPVTTGTELIEGFGFGRQGAGLGMADSHAGYLYVSDTSTNAINIFKPATAPDAEMHSSVFVDLTTAKLRAKVNPQGLTLDSCEFRWGASTAYENGAVPCDALPTGSSESEVSTADLTVVAGNTYHAQVVVKADNGTATYSRDLEWQAPDLADVTTLGVGPQQRKGTVVLGGTINPKRTPTGYFVEYSTDPSLASPDRYPTGESRSAGSGNTAAKVRLVVPGLENGKTYYFRLVAETAAGRTEGGIESFRTFTEPSRPQPSSCPNAKFRKGAGAVLPDCRAWEMVSPVEKAGGNVGNARIVASTDGRRVAFGSDTAFNDGVIGVGISTTYFAERGDEAWDVFSVAPAFTLNQSAIGNGSAGYTAYTPDLGRMMSSDDNIDLGGPNVPTSNSSLFMWDAEARSISLLARAGYNRIFAGAEINARDALSGLAEDGRSGFFSARAPIPVEQGPEAEQRGIYWWSEADGVKLASVLPDGQPAPANPSTPSALQSGLSRDGERLVWVVQEWADRPGSYEVMLSEQGGGTTWVTEPQGVSPVPASSGMSGMYDFYGTPDLGYVFIISGSALTADATATTASPDLYRFDVESGTLEDLTTSDASGAGVQEVIGLSEDGKRAYFLAKGNLAPGASGANTKLYVWDDGEVRFISNFNGSSGLIGLLSLEQAGFSRLTRTSADGRYLLFAHDGATAGTAMEGMYETNGKRMLYRYDLDEDRIDCVSCHPEGLDATADAYLTMPHNFRYVSYDAPPRGPERYFMSDDGRVMFVTKQALLPVDNNQAEDTYLWDGDLQLLTSGSGSWPQWAETASEDFKDVFVLTTAQLVPADIDHSADLYVASINGGLASQQVRPRGAQGCTGEACQGLAAERPAQPRLGTQRAGRGQAIADSGATCAARRKAVRRAVARRQAARHALKKGRVAARRVAANGRRAAARKTVRRHRLRLKRATKAQKRARAALRACVSSGGQK